MHGHRNEQLAIKRGTDRYGRSIKVVCNKTFGLRVKIIILHEEMVLDLILIQLLDLNLIQLLAPTC